MGIPSYVPTTHTLRDTQQNHLPHIGRCSQIHRLRLLTNTVSLSLWGQLFCSFPKRVGQELSENAPYLCSTA